MSNCLGIYIDKNLIKYAKLKKSKNKYKVEVFDSVIFEDLEETLKKIISETNSYNVPISLNISNDEYCYFDVFSALEKKDIDKSVEIEFEKICKKNDIESSNFDTRYTLLDDKENFEKYKTLLVVADKKELETKIRILQNNKIFSMMPISIAINNLAQNNEENYAILNIENDTVLSFSENSKISKVIKLENNLQNAIQKISNTEMSLKKAYNILKNITLSTNVAEQLDSSENEYIDIVLPEVDKIFEEVKQIIKTTDKKINKLYITGSGALINNIDLYFGDLFEEKIECEILKPFFVDTSSVKLPIKEYIEVNSAIALALEGLNLKNKDLNFSMVSTIDNIDNVINSGDSIKDIDWKEEYSVEEKLILRGIAACIIAIVCFIIFSVSISSNNLKKIAIAEEKIAETKNQLSIMDTQISKVNSYTKTYNEIINPNQDRIISKDSIPNMLNKIMFLIPKTVQLESIENTEKNHIVIILNSQSNEDLNSFVKSVKENKIFDNIQTKNENLNNNIQMTLEGDLK